MQQHVEGGAAGATAAVVSLLVLCCDTCLLQLNQAIEAGCGLMP
jgi:hypothetical protein